MKRFALSGAWGILISLSLMLAIAEAQPLPGDNPYQMLFDMHEAVGPVRAELDEADDNTGYDALHYNLEIRFYPTTESVTGRVDMLFSSTIAALTDLAMQFRYNMVVDCVLVDGAETTFTLTWEDNFNVDLPTTLGLGDSATVTTFYHGNPYGSPSGLGGLYFDTHLGTPIVSSLSEPEGARNWWPCKDMPHDKATARLVWTVPSGFYATGNGLLQSVSSPEPGWRSYEWMENYPITTYLIAVTATNFVHFRNWYVTVGGDSMPLDHYVYPEDSLEATIDFADLADVISYFASVFEEYPFIEEKYGHAAFPFGGAMEHQTLTSYGAALITGQNTYHYIMVHELSHQWWGDMVTCETWMDLWLNEGFATYCDALWIEHAEGWAAFVSRMNEFRQYYMQAEANWEGRFPIYDPQELWGATVYEKGSWILHMIRYVIGEDHFWNLWPEYRSRFAFDAVTDSEFQQTVEDVSGMDLDWFFWEWVYMAGYPEYHWGWQTQAYGEDSTRVDLSILQVQELIEQTPIFTMPIELKVTKNTGFETAVVWDSLPAQNFSFVVSGNVLDVQFDPDNWILKTAQEGPYIGVTGELETPRQYHLALSIGPNPANPSTRIRIELPAAQKATLAIYNLLGQKVATLLEVMQPAGEANFVWDGSAQASGVYLVRLDTSTEHLAQKLILLK